MHLAKRSDRRTVRSGVISACAGAALCFCVSSGWSQTSYEASGQTVVFTLTPGAKASPLAVIGGSGSRFGKNAVSITSARGFIVVSLSSQPHGPSDISIYDMAGRQAYRQRGFSGGSLRLETRRFAPGMYNILVRIDGRNYSRRFAVSR
jgi:hypothetical protein